MKDQSKTKKVLIQELASLKQRISELEQAKPELKQAAEDSRGESLFRQSIIDNAADGICVCHDVPEFPYIRFTVWNRHMTNITGYTMAEINRQGWYQAVSPDPAMQAKAIARMDRMRQGDNLDQEEWEITRKDGQRRQLLVSTCIMPGGETGVNMLAVMNDITDRKWTENALLESKEQYRSLVENASDIVFRTDSSGHFTFVNPAAVRITGYGEKELIGKHYPTLIRPDMRDEAVKFFGRQFVKGINNTYSEYPILTKDGHDVWLGQNTQLIVENGRVNGFQAVSRDISERKRVEDELRKSESKYQFLVECMADVVFMLDMNLVTTYVSPSIEKMLGFTPEERITQNIDRQLTSKSRKLVSEVLIAELEREKEKGADPDRSHTMELEYYHKDGSIRHLATYIRGIRDSEGKLTGFYGSGHDITDRRRAEETLRLITDNMSDMVRVTDLQGLNLYASPSHYKGLGYTSEERAGKSVFDIVHPDDLERVTKVFSDGLANRKPAKLEYRVKHAEGHYVWLETVGDLLQDDRGEMTAVVMSSRDITERKQAEDNLRIKEMQLRTIIESTGDGILAVDNAGNMIKVNQRFADLWKIPPDMLEGSNDEDLLKYVSGQLVDPAAFLEKVQALYRSTAEGFDTISFKDGRALERYSCPLMSEGVVKGRVWSFRDITERKRAEEMLRRSEEKFRFLTENMNDNIFTMNMNLQTTYVSQSIEKILGFTPEERMKQNVTEQVTPESMTLIAKIFSEEIEREAKGLGDPNRSIKFEVEYYHKDGSTVWMENVISGIRDDQGVAVGIHGVSRDITERKRSEHALKDSLDRLHKSLGATIQAMAVTVETRDPYTAGHQRRVADLARSIAGEMNLPANQIEGIRMASTIHDLGKISVPAEILSKPTKLSDVEFELIKTHAQSGYDILKDIDFPWPVARIILEHHEKMDGSGYPNGSVGDNLLLESRILAVADVVEAMASHRPYRPSLGLAAAFRELEENKGTKYDAAVVEACLCLFMKKGYNFVNV